MKINYYYAAQSLIFTKKKEKRLKVDDQSLITRQVLLQVLD